MLTVEEYEVVRRAVLVNGMSQREAARTFGHGRDTIRKMLAQAEPPGYQRTQAIVRPILDPYTSLVDAWLADEAQRGVPRKQRSNATVLWKRLCTEHGFTGSVYPVRRYLRDKRKKQKEVFVPLDFQPGQEGQVDWGQAQVMLAGVLLTVHLFCLRLCYSRASFVRAYASEKLECFLDGHVRAFAFFGGCAQTLAYDNLKTAVVRMGRGQERHLHKRFIALRSHYLFASRFCNVASGNEKGRVENQVKAVQQGPLAGVPSFADWDELNAYLEAWCRGELTRKAPHTEKTRGELFDQEKLQFLPLPAGEFLSCQEICTFASKQALVQYETNFYSLPVSCAHQSVTIRAYAERIDLLCAHQVVASHVRSWGRDQHVLDYLHYVPLLAKKPGSLRHGRPFQGKPWGEDLEVLRRELEHRRPETGSREFITVLQLCSEHGPEQVQEAVRACVQRRVYSADAVRSILLYEPPIPKPTLTDPHPLEEQITTDGIRPATAYDVLLGQTVKDDTAAKEKCA